MRSYTDLLRGVRVVELCWAWAGPLAARTLADLGAEVIKVEGPGRPDGVRFGTYPNDDPGTEPWNRGCHFQKHARNKKSLVLDLNRPEGHAAFMALIETADIFIENNAPRVLPNLGITYADISARNPKIIMVSMPGFGNSGPDRDWVGFGLNLETFCGLSNVTGYADSGPVRSVVPYGDPIAGLHAPVAMLAALREVRRTGKGRYIEIAQNESLMNVLIEPWLRANALHEPVTPDGCHHEFIAPHNIYQAATDEDWVAIAAVSAESFAALATVVDHPEWVTDPGLQSPYDRKAREAELDAAIAGWARSHERGAIVAELVAAGVPCTPAQRIDEIVHDPLLARRGYWTEIDHPVTGRLTYSYLPWRYWRSEPVVPTYAPLFGEHNREVLEGMLHMPSAEVDALEAAGTIATRPNMA